MFPAVRNRPTRLRMPRSRRLAAALSALAAVAVAAALIGCGASLKHGDASADVDGASGSSSCPAAALEALAAVARRVYREGIYSERTISALRIVTGSTALRQAVEAGDASAAQIAARDLLATGHLTNLRVVRGGRTLVELGGAAITPLQGTLKNASGKPIASFTTSVWSDAGIIAETSGIAEASTVVRSAPRAGAARTVAGEFTLPRGALPAQGTLTQDGVAYQYTSYPASAYPDGAPLRVYLVRTISSLKPLCGADAQSTQFNTISHIAHLIYEGEAGKRTLPQIRRVQGDAALLSAVAARNPKATRKAVEALLHHHLVRLRIEAGGRLLEDDGGPYVLAPVSAPLRLHGRTIGTLTLSIQDDEGYKRLAARLAGLDVLMYMGPRLVKSTIGFSPGTVPTSGPFTFHGKSYRAYTFYGDAFPSGPLRITDLIPVPYS
jgi:hypothetical protein